MAFLEILARIESSQTPPGYEELKNAAGQAPRKAALCFVMTTYVKALERLVEELNHEGRKVSVILPSELNEQYHFPQAAEVLSKII
jgi:hypothetical protein